MQHIQTHLNQPQAATQMARGIQDREAVTLRCKDIITNPGRGPSPNKVKQESELTKFCMIVHWVSQVSLQDLQCLTPGRSASACWFLILTWVSEKWTKYCMLQLGLDIWPSKRWTMRSWLVCQRVSLTSCMKEHIQRLKRSIRPTTSEMNRNDLKKA